MTQTEAVVAVIQDYFNLAYEPKSRDFSTIFHPDCRVQWVQDDRLQILTSSEYAALINGRPSPRSTGAPRDEGILSVENVSDDLSTATVRVRIGNKLFNDHFVLHQAEGIVLYTSSSPGCRGWKEAFTFNEIAQRL
jgi:hypothetical protein